MYHLLAHFNTAFDGALADYTGAYENSLHYSPTFRRYAEEQAATIVDRYDLHYKTIVEIGCGDAYFLKLLCSNSITVASVLNRGMVRTL